MVISKACRDKNNKKTSTDSRVIKDRIKINNQITPVGKATLQAKEKALR